MTGLGEGGWKPRTEGSGHQTGECGHIETSLPGIRAKHLVKLHYLYLNDFMVEVITPNIIIGVPVRHPIL